MNGKKTHRPSHDPPPWEFTVHVLRDAAGPAILSEPVRPGDLTLLFSETWQARYLRKGSAGVGFDDITFRLEPEPVQSDATACPSLRVVCTGPEGRARTHRADITALAHVAVRGAERLVAEGALSANAPYHWYVSARRPDPAAGEDGSRMPRSRLTREPLRCPSIPLADYLDRSTAVGAVQGWVPVFFRRQALTMAERFSRQGMAASPTFESGAVLLGNLGSCPRSGELFVVVTEAVELMAATQTHYSLAYTGDTWHHVQQDLAARRRNPRGRFLQIVGQSHGHNFVPRPDHDPEEREPRRMSSVFVSSDDLAWSRAVFAYQPWAVCLIFGYTARSEPVQGLFGFRGGHLVERGFHIFDNPESVPGSTTGQVRLVSGPSRPGESR